jgi:hypothetical protein
MLQMMVSFYWINFCFHQGSPIHFAKNHNLDQKEWEGATKVVENMLG